MLENTSDDNIIDNDEVSLMNDGASSNNTNSVHHQDYTQLPSHPRKSIRDIGFMEDQNSRFRRTMEDGHCMIDGFRGNPKEGYFAIYDGHGGKAAVNHVQKMMHIIFEKALETCSSVEDAFSEAYRLTDEELKDAQYNGTTAITCFLAEQNNEKILYTANCGDARVVISEGGIAKRLTFDHKASDESEVQRIKDTSGFVAFNRVNGILAVTRALGDHAMKQWVISEPYQSAIKISDQHVFLILACDGIWDVFDDQEAVNFVHDLLDKHKLSAQEIARRLLEKSLEKGSTDNISVMIVIL